MHERSCWRLLAAFSLAGFLLVLLAQSLLRGQSATQDREPRLPPDLAQSRVALPPVLSDYPGLPPGPFSTAPSSGIFFPQVIRAAGMIFSGRVTAITAARASAQEMPTVSITFRVENALRGVTRGQSLTIHEWAGLWTGGERYRVGERVLLFLYPPSRIGLTSPVAGTLGRFPVDSRGYVLFQPQHLQAFWADPGLGGKTSMSVAGFARAVRGASGEE